MSNPAMITLVFIAFAVWVPTSMSSPVPDTTAPSEETKPPMRWCTISVEEEAKCVEMKNAFRAYSLELEVECVRRGEHADCYKAIRDGHADLITLDGGEIYEAGKEYGLVPIIKETYTRERYYAIAVVRANDTDINITNLKGRKSCHTGVRRTAGWVVPVGFLLDKGYMDPVDCGDDINAVAQFFNKSCAPGAFTASKNPYGTNPAHLCGICTNPQCPPDSSELYQSYAGAFRCLVEGAGDVAFIKPEAFLANMGLPAGDKWNSALNPNDYRLLCPDGSRGTIDDAPACNFAKSPAHAVVTSPTKSVDDIQAFQSVLRAALPLFAADNNTRGFRMFDSGENRDLLFKDYARSLKDLQIPQTYKTYLGGYANSIAGLKRCPPNTLRWCTTSIDETRKCRSMKAAFSAAGLTPALSCYEEEGVGTCMERIAAGYADVMTVDGGDLYTGGREHHVVPVAAEDYEQGDASYWAVAVARKETNFGLDDLAGRRSCHTGIGKTSGWNVPIGTLIRQGYITVNSTTCNVPEAVGKFFNSSCAPGAKSSKYDPNGDNPASLCNQCRGTGDRHCARSGAEPYYGYAGAFRCLAEGQGDVAFVKHTTVAENTDFEDEDDDSLGWNADLVSSDYELLCLNGSRAPVDQFMSCNLARVPAHVVVTAANKTEAEREEIWNLLDQAQGLFGSDTGTNFKMFDSADFGGSNLLFKDSTKHLSDVGDRDEYDTWLGADYLGNLDALNCVN
ncbi:melanotransferrin-like [Diadema antillarum]|uniref:melanotransferrin-like n=1 Tax=Diadema antillarum TaxID=105358 RepID=UPI003A8B877D